MLAHPGGTALSPTQVLAPASLSSRRYSSTTSFVHLRPQGDCLSSTQETGAKTGMGKDRPKVKLSKGDKRGLAHVGRLLPCADHFPVQASPPETHLGKSGIHPGLTGWKCGNCEMLVHLLAWEPVGMKGWCEHRRAQWGCLSSRVRKMGLGWGGHQCGEGSPFPEDAAFPELSWGI